MLLVLILLAIGLAPFAFFHLLPRFFRPGPWRARRIWRAHLAGLLLMAGALLAQCLSLDWNHGWPALGWSHPIVWNLGFLVLNLPWVPRNRRLAMEEAVRNRGVLPDPAAVVRMQGALLALPVMGLIVFGVVALVRDRAAARAGVYERMGGLAEELADRLSRSMPGKLSELEVAASWWTSSGRTAPGRTETTPARDSLEQTSLRELALFGIPDGPERSAYLPIRMEMGTAELAQFTEAAGGVPGEKPSARSLDAWERLRQSDEALTQDSFNVIRDLVLHGGPALAAQALEQGNRMARKTSDPDLVRVLNELGNQWRAEDRWSRLKRKALSQGDVPSNLILCRWLRDGDDEYFVDTQPWAGPGKFGVDERGQAGTNRSISIRIFRKSMMESAAYLGFHTVSIQEGGREVRRGPGIPAGFKIAVWLEDVRLDLPTGAADSWAVAPGEKLASDGATATRGFVQQGTWVDGRPFDSWPSHPRLKVGVYLAEPDLQFGVQRRNQSLFGGLILATAGLAAWGAWQAHAALRTQVQLANDRSNFVSAVSHELRAPLASMRLFADGLAADGALDESKRKEHAGWLARECQRMAALVDQILDFSRWTSGRRRLHFEPVLLDRLVGETVHSWRPMAEARSLKVNVTMATFPDVCGEEPVAGGVGWDVDCDPGAMQQVLVNLLDNAVKFSPAGGSIAVELGWVAGESRRWRLSVSNDGPGIPAGERERVFEPFYRAGCELRRRAPGVGLGLAIVRQIVGGHGGRVWVEDERKEAHSSDRGVRIIMEIPSAQATDFGS